MKILWLAPLILAKSCIEIPCPVPSPVPSPSPVISPSPIISPSPSPIPTPEPTPLPTPTPLATPETCPKMNQWGMGGPNQICTGNCDSTPKFGVKRLPCNEEHHAVCSISGDDHGKDWRHCEDPRGGRWEVRDGAELKRIENPGPDTGFRAIVKGPGKIRVCPLPDLRDELGEPVAVIGCNVAQNPDCGCSPWVTIP